MRGLGAVTILLSLLTALSVRAADAVPPRGGAGTGDLVRATANGVDSLLSRARECMVQRQWADAVQLMTQVLSLDAANEIARFGLGTAYVKVGRFREAETLLQDLLKQYPNNPALINNLAWTYAIASDPAIRDGEKAVGYARQALMLAPADFNIWGTLAEAYYAAGRFDRALRWAMLARQAAMDAATAAIVSGPDRDNWWVSMAKLQYAAGHRDEARRAAVTAYSQLRQVYNEIDLEEFDRLYLKCQAAAGDAGEAKAGN